MITGVPKLILVEGVPGSGKSSMAQIIALGLQRAGQKARWHHENDRNHPLFPSGVVGENSSERIAAWSRFVKETLEQDEIVVLESALFQKQLNRLLKGGREIEIEPFFTALFDVIRPVAPLLIYFNQTEMKPHVEWLIGQRGEGTLPHFLAILHESIFAKAADQMDAALVAHYFEKIQTRTALEVNRFPGDTVILTDSKQDWLRARRHVFEQLGIPSLVFPQLPEDTAKKITGNYKCADGIELVEIVMEKGRLRFVHDGVLQAIDLAKGHFFIDNRPDEVRFVFGDEGAVRFSLGAWVMLGSRAFPRPMPDRFTYERIFEKLKNQNPR